MSNYRQDIVDAIKERLETIAPGKVFQLGGTPYVCTSATMQVYPWRKVPFKKDELPALRLVDVDADVLPGPSGQHEHSLNFNLEAVVLKDTTASAAREILADIVAAIGSDPRWGGLAYWTNITGHEVDLEQSGDIVSGVQVLFNVTYRTPLWRM